MYGRKNIHIFFHDNLLCQSQKGCKYNLFFNSLGPPVVFVSACVAVLFYVPLSEKIQDISTWNNPIEVKQPDDSIINLISTQFNSAIPILDFVISGVLLVSGVMFFSFEKVHNKIVENRLQKLQLKLMRSVEKIKEFDKQREHLETTLKMVQNATTEYNLLLFLLMDKDHNFKPDCGDSLYRDHEIDEENQCKN